MPLEPFGLSQADTASTLFPAHQARDVSPSMNMFWRWIDQRITTPSQNAPHHARSFGGIA